MAGYWLVLTIRRLRSASPPAIRCAAAMAVVLAAAMPGLAKAQSVLTVANTPFPQTTVGQSAQQSVTLTVNTGGNSVVFNSIKLAPGFSEYTLGTITGCVVDSFTGNTDGAVCTVPITFTPKLPGNASAPVPIARTVPLLISDVENGTPQMYALSVSGSGTTPLPVFSPGIISDIVGSDKLPLAAAGYAGDGGPASGAVFNGPTSMAVDTLGNIYIADTGNCVVRRVDATTHKIALFAGMAPTTATACGLGTDGVSPTASMLNHPTGITLDGAGNLYIADTANADIRMVSAATGLITTIAGTPGTACAQTSFATTCGDGGLATAAQLNAPMGVAVDGHGNLFIADTGDSVVREVAATGANAGIIVTVAGVGGQQGSYAQGDGVATAIPLDTPQAVTLDSQGNLFIADPGVQAIWVVAAGTTEINNIYTGIYIPSSSGGTNIPPGPPTSLAVDATDNLYYTQSGSCVVYQNPTPALVPLQPGVGRGFQTSNIYAGNGSCTPGGDLGFSTSAGLNNPQAVTADASGNLYILEADGVRFIDASGTSTNFALAFGNVNIGVTSSPLQFSIANGDVLGAITSSGQTYPAINLSVGVANYPPSPFQLISPTLSNGYACNNSALNPSYSCAFSVNFLPQADQLYTGTLGFYTQHSDGNGYANYSLPLSGTGTGSLPTATLTGGPLNFTAIVHEGNAPVQTLTLTNTSTTTPLTISYITVNNFYIQLGGTVGANATNCPSVLAVGASCTIGVTFSANATGAQNFSIVVTDNTASGTQTAMATGTGTAPVASLSPSNIAFSGTQPVGTVSTAQPITLSNTGNAPLTISSLTLTGLNPEQFSLNTTGCPTVLPPPPSTSNSCQVLVAFQPIAGGSYSATLNVADDSGGQIPGVTVSQTASITGGSPIAVQADSFTLANNVLPTIAVGATETQNVTLAINTANTVLKSIAFPAYPEFVISSVSGCTVDGVTKNAAGSLCTLAVTYSPTLVSNARNATLLVTTIENSIAVPYAFGITAGATGSIAALTPGITRAYLANVNGSSSYNPGCSLAICGLGGFGGPAIAGSVGYTVGEAIDGAENLYVSDSYYDIIYKVSSAGTLTLFAGVPFNTGGYQFYQTGDGNAAVSAHLGQPGPLAVDRAGNVYVGAGETAIGNGSGVVTQGGLASIRRIDAATGIISTVVGGGAGCVAQTDTYGDGCTGAQFNFGTLATLNSITFDNLGNMYFDATYNQGGLTSGTYWSHSINRVDAVTGIVTLFAGTMSSTIGTGVDNGPALNANLTPGALATDSSNDVLVTDNALKIRKITPLGIISTVAGNGPPLPPSGNSYPQCSSALYSAASLADNIPALTAGFGAITGITTDPANNIYFVDNDTCRVRRIDAGTGLLQTVAGEGSFITAEYGDLGDPFLTTDGSALLAGFYFPLQVVLDASANMYVMGKGDVRQINVSQSVQDFDRFFSQVYPFDRDTNPVGSVSSPLNTTVVNAGNSGTVAFQAPFTTPTAFGISGPDFTRDTAATDCIATGSIAPGFECSINDDFTPTYASGTNIIQELHTVNDTGAAPTQTITLIGDSSGTAGLTLLPSLLSFVGTINVPTTSQAFILTNNTAIAVPLTGISIIGVNPAVFSQTNNCGSSVGPTSSCTITVTFTAPAAGQFLAQVSVAYTASISGTNYPATLTGGLTGTVGTPLASLTPDAYDFGAVPVGTTAGPMNFTLKNIGQVPLAISTIAIAGDLPDFTLLANNCGTSLAVNAFCSIPVTFSPQSITPLTSFSPFKVILSVTDNASNSPQQSTITGSGIAGSTPAVINLAETIHVTDTFTDIPPVLLNLAETIHVTDTFLNNQSAFIGVNEIIHVNDAITYPKSAFIGVNETIHVTDSFLPSLAVLLNIAETIHVTDTVNPSVSLITDPLTFAVPNHTYGDAPFTLSASSPSTGAVSYGYVSGPASLSGNTLTLTGAGSVIVSASQAQTATYVAASNVQASFTVAQQATHSLLSTSSSSVQPGQTVIFTAAIMPAVLGSPTGSVLFYDNGVQLGSSVPLLASTATTPAIALTSGTHTITAHYSGDTNFLAGSVNSPAPVVVTVATLDFSFTLTGSQPLSILPGTSANFNLSLAPNAGLYPGVVNFSLSGLPAGATGTFTPSTIGVSAGPQTVQLAIDVPATIGAVPSSRRASRVVGFTFALLLLPFAGLARTRFARRLRLARLASLLILLGGMLAVASGLTACGTGNGYFGQQPQDYPITVTATSGSIQHSVVVTLQVQ